MWQVRWQLGDMGWMLLGCNCEILTDTYNLAVLGGTSSIGAHLGAHSMQGFSCCAKQHAMVGHGTFYAELGVTKWSREVSLWEAFTSIVLALFHS